MDVQPFGWNGSSWIAKKTANVFKTVTFTTTGGTVWTPATGKKFRLLGFSLGLAGNTIQAVAGVNTVTFTDGGVAMPIAVPLYIPAASLNVLGVAYTRSGALDDGIVSAAANNVLAISYPNALTAGALTVFVYGIEE